MDSSVFNFKSEMKLIEVKEVIEGKGSVCSKILSHLPKWFGRQDSVLEHIELVENYTMFAAYKNGELVGFISAKENSPATIEIYVMAVELSQHRQGIGSLLVSRVEDFCRKKAFKLLLVKTVGPSRDNNDYKKTRMFYAARGFLELEEILNFWEQNPGLFLVKPI
ncbi:MAG: GNAT family N-acetyltransferase [Bdellovibrionales bacterium]